MRLLDSKEWTAGYDAYFNFRARNDNPYDEDREEQYFENWENGWDCADSDCDDE